MLTLSIAAVERDTGISKDTLRVWERRYGFPTPGRDSFGERVYPLEQVDKLRVICRLMDAGHRPGKIIQLPVEQLHALAEQSASAPRSAADLSGDKENLEKYLGLCKSHKIDELRRALYQSSLRIGLESFVTDVVAPLTQMVGEAWARGYFEVFEEHLYTESMQVVLRNSISTIPQPGHRPNILLTTFSNESHGLGLLMAEAIMALHGAKCFSLGVQTPILEIARASKVQPIDIVALSFSTCLNPNQVLDGLSELKSHLHPKTEIWAGGYCPVLQRKPPSDIRIVTTLNSIQDEIKRWRSTNLNP